MNPPVRLAGSDGDQRRLALFVTCLIDLFRPSVWFATQTIAAVDGHDHVIVPSGSRAGAIAEDYPDMFDDAPEWRARAGRASRLHDHRP